jgi:hypothetical protein
MRDWLVSLNSSSQTDVVHIDFAKAFDCIVTSKLLFKLEMDGITAQLVKRISAFLTNQTQHVVISYCFSCKCAAVSGVPQGSVLGPKLFLVYIMISSIYAVAKQDFSSLQTTLKSIVLPVSKMHRRCFSARLTTTWLNVPKSGSYLSILVNELPFLTGKLQPTSRTYYIDGMAIPCHNSYVKLGIIVINEWIVT